jgi:hypothetical protein
MPEVESVLKAENKISFINSLLKLVQPVEITRCSSQKLHKHITSRKTSKRSFKRVQKATIRKSQHII